MANLKVGSSGEDVKKLQEELIAKGYDVGGTKADGVFGKNTLAAVKQYQKDNGLAVDGIAGKNTLGSLYGAANKPVNKPADKPADKPAANPPAADVPGADAPEAAPPAAAPEGSFSYPSFSYDPYAQSDTVLQANTLLQQHSATKPGAYQSQWDAAIQNYLNQIQNREDFSYDVNSDALYQQYRDLYTQQGQLAMMDTMGQAAAMTGGYGNSYAQSVGQQMYNQQLGKLNEIVPELYQQAYNRYTQEGQDLYNMYSLAMDQENMAYGRYQDQMNAWQSEQDRLQDNYNAEREFDYGRYEGDRALAYDAYSSDRTMAYNSYLDAYNKERDKVKDSQWQAEFDEDKRRYEQNREDAKSKSSGTGTVKTEKEPTYLDAEAEKRWMRDAESKKSSGELDELWQRMLDHGVAESEIAYILRPYYDALAPKPLTPPKKGSVGTGGGGGGGTMYWVAK